MRLCILTVGSRGDIQPHIALGLGLKAAGHNVCLASHGSYGDEVRRRGLDFLPVAGRPQEIVKEAGHLLLETGHNFYRFMQEFKGILEPLAWQLLNDLQAACRGADAILYSAFTFPGHYLAREMGVPAVMTAMQPLMRSRYHPTLLAPLPSSLGGLLNLATHLVAEQFFWQPLRPAVNRWRQEQGLGKAPFFGHFRQLYREATPQICGFSPVVFPKPRDWGKHIHITGYWFLDSERPWTPPAALAEFLAIGPSPICVGFGSMTSHDLGDRLALVLEALAQKKRRAVLLTGWSGEPTIELPEWVFHLEQAPHDWLFPQVAAVIHHGGAGTTAAAMRAGVPSVVMPFFFDQFFWGKRVSALGVGPAPIARKKLSVHELAAAIETAVGDQAMRRRTELMGRVLRAEDGISRAVRAVEGHLLISR